MTATPTPRTRTGLDTVVLATRNPKKLAELRRILDEAGPGVTVLGLDEVPAYPEPAETERTFEGNALIKARAAAERTGHAALADDSGIEVDALNGMPGVRSARWAGPGASDAENLALLLRQVDDVPAPERTARFVCAMALVIPAQEACDEVEYVVRATLEGRLGREARGTHGFGYDPAFVADGHTRTNGELDPAEKDAISHRGQAVRRMAAIIADLRGGSR